MSINFEVHNVTCLHIQEARTSTRIGQQTESDRQQWRDMTVTTADGRKISLCFYGCRENDYLFPLVIGGEDE